MVDRIATTRPAFHLLAGDICYADPSGEGHPVKSTGTSKSPTRVRQLRPDGLDDVLRADRAQRRVDAVDVRHRQPRHGGALRRQRRPRRPARLRRARRPPRPAEHRSERAARSVYSMRYGNVGVVSVDANDLSMEIPTNAGYSGGAQLDLAAADPRRAARRPGHRLRRRLLPPLRLRHLVDPRLRRRGARGGGPAVRRVLRRPRAAGPQPPVRAHRTRSAAAARRRRPRTASTVRPETDGTTYVCVGSGGRPRYSWQPGETDRYRGDPAPDRAT